MSITTLLHYLIGRQSAIEAAARCRGSLWLGLLFVLSAGFAREYDGEDLWREPWHVLLPLAASLLTSFLLFALIEVAVPGKRGEKSERFLGRYRTFLGLYWLTAPLAWLYAIPLERFTSAADAVRLNLLLLAIVSVWRVALMTRIVSLLYVRSAPAAFFLVMLFADSVAMVVFWMTPLPILSIMGGIRLSESEQLIQEAGFQVRFLGTVSWPLWLIGAIVVAVRGRRRLSKQEPRREPLEGERRRVTMSLWALAAMSVLVWMAILPLTQPEQVNRGRVERMLLGGHVDEALAYMSAREREAFPPHWDPPPRFGYGQRVPALVPLLIAAQQPHVAPWVRELFYEKLSLQSLAYPWSHYDHAVRLVELSDEQLVRYARLLESHPKGPSMARYHRAECLQQLDPPGTGLQGPELSDARRAALEEILDLLPEEDLDGRER